MAKKRNLSKQQVNFIRHTPEVEAGVNASKLYIAIVTVLIVAPVVVMVIALATNRTVQGLLFAVICYLLLVLQAFRVSRKRERIFFAVEDGHKRFAIHKVDDAEVLKELQKDSSLTFGSEPTDDQLDFVYNWLYHTGVIEKEPIDVYCYTGATLKKVFRKKGYRDDQPFFSIYLKDLGGTQDQRRRMFSEHLEAGARYLDDMVK